MQNDVAAIQSAWNRKVCPIERTKNQAARKTSFAQLRKHIERGIAMNAASSVTTLEHAVIHSKQYSDNLYHFAKMPDRIISALVHKGFTLNYVVEDLSFLNIEQVSSIAFPMICFCDIAPEETRLKPHRDQYGSYGIGLSEKWGMKNGVQPVHYILSTSPFAQDFTQALEAAFSASPEQETGPLNTLCDFLITNLAFTKPIWGTNNGTDYCFEDECEWRFIPADLPSDMPRFLVPTKVNMLDNYRRTLWQPTTYLLEFDYDDISDIFAAKGEASELRRKIGELAIAKEEKELLLTKVREG